MSMIPSQEASTAESGGQGFSWEAVTALSTAVLALVTAGLLLGVLLAYRQYRDSRLGQQVTLLQDQQDKYRADTIRRARELLGDTKSAVRSKLDAAAAKNGDLIVSDLPSSELSQTNDLLSFFEFLAALVKFNALDFDQVVAVFPTAPRKYWEITKPYISARRTEEGNDSYLASYEELVKRYERRAAARPSPSVR